MDSLKELFCIPFRKKSDDELSKREDIVKNFFERMNFSWKGFQNLVFWETPLLSFTIFLAVTGIFWLFLLVFMKKVALCIIIVAFPMCINEVRDIVLHNLRKEHGLKVINTEKQLPFSMDHVTNTIASIWIVLENHYFHIVDLKESSSSKLSIWLGLYISIPLIIFAYFPVASILYGIFVCFYFYPLLTYTNIVSVLQSRLLHAFQPVFKHWKHSQTKRRRDTGKASFAAVSPTALKMSSFRNTEEENNYSDHDSENDAFLPEETYYNKKMLKSAIPILRSASASHKDMSDDGSSDFDQDSFIPSENLELDEPMPSMSQFDSMMEPLDDEFHTGLKFQDSISSSQFGIPKNFAVKKGNSFGLTDTDTDNEIDDLPFEENNYTNSRNMQGNNKDGISEYEMLEKSEVLNVTDEELNKHLKNTVESSKSKVSAFLGY